MAVLPEHPKGESRAIRTIDVQDLLGRFSYTLQAPEPSSVDMARLMILYGDNGTGKTTILSALFHLLSTAPRGGHKSALANIAFKRIGVVFTNGLELSAERSK